MTIGGLHGIIVGLKEKKAILILKVGKNIDITINRSAIAGLEKNVTSDETTSIEGKN